MEQSNDTAGSALPTLGASDSTSTSYQRGRNSKKVWIVLAVVGGVFGVTVLLCGGSLAFLITRFLTIRTQVDAAKINAAKSQVRLLTTPLELYNLDIGAYPPTLDGLLQPPKGLPDPKKWSGPYLDKLPVDPWGQSYQYRYPGQHGDKPDVWTVSPNGVQIGNWE
jgi:general secretion pathway protein G